MKRLESILVITVAAAMVPCVAAPAPAAFWVADATACRITHDCNANEPLVMCMQGRKVVMQVQVDAVNGFSYKAGFYHVRPDDTPNTKKILFEAGPAADPELRVDDQVVKCGVPASAAFDGLLTTALKGGSGAYVNLLATGTAGTGTVAAAAADGGPAGPGRPGPLTLAARGATPRA